jgi:hypothetical protein
LEVEELAMDLKALDPAREVDPRILLIANRREGKSTIIRPDIGLKGPAERIITRKEVREVWRGLADPGKDDVALLATGLKGVVRGGEVEGPASRTAARKRTQRMWGSWSEA